MPRSVIVLSSDPNLFEHLRVALRADSRFVDTDRGLHCDGSEAPLTNIYPVENDPVEWKDWQTPVGVVPDPRTMTTLIFETKSPEWVAEVGELLARDLEWPVWFVDAADVAWLSDRVDPAKIALT